MSYICVVGLCIFNLKIIIIQMNATYYDFFNKLYEYTGLVDYLKVINHNRSRLRF